MNEFNKYIYVIDSFRGIMRQYLYIKIYDIESTQTVKLMKLPTLWKFFLISSNWSGGRCLKNMLTLV